MCHQVVRHQVGQQQVVRRCLGRRRLSPLAVPQENQARLRKLVKGTCEAIHTDRDKNSAYGSSINRRDSSIGPQLQPS